MAWKYFDSLCDSQLINEYHVTAMLAACGNSEELARIRDRIDDLRAMMAHKPIRRILFLAACPSSHLANHAVAAVSVAPCIQAIAPRGWSVDCPRCRPMMSSTPCYTPRASAHSRCTHDGPLLALHAVQTECTITTSTAPFPPFLVSKPRPARCYPKILVLIPVGVEHRRTAPPRSVSTDHANLAAVAPPP